MNINSKPTPTGTRRDVILPLSFASVIVVCLSLFSGCATTEYPDGSIETRLDLPAAELGLNTAMSLYNVYMATVAAPEPSRLTELLDNVDRALALVNYVRVGRGLEPIEILKGQTIEIQEDL